MADSVTDDLREDPLRNPEADIDMEEGEGEGDEGANPNGSALPFSEEGPDAPVAARTSFITYLTSPVVTLIVGIGETETILTAHQSLLVQSPYFQEVCAEFADDGSVCSKPGLNSTLDPAAVYANKQRSTVLSAPAN